MFNKSYTIFFKDSKKIPFLIYVIRLCYEKLKIKFDERKFDVNYAESVIHSADKAGFKKYNYKVNIL